MYCKVGDNYNTNFYVVWSIHMYIFKVVGNLKTFFIFMLVACSVGNLNICWLIINANQLSVDLLIHFCLVKFILLLNAVNAYRRVDSKWMHKLMTFHNNWNLIVITNVGTTQNKYNINRVCVKTTK